MSRKPRAKKQTRRGAGLFLLAAALIAAVLYLSGGTRVYKGARQADVEIAESRALLAQMERQTPVDPNEEIRRQRRETLAARGGIMVDDLAAEQGRILASTEWSRADIARWFQNAAVMGDSIIVAVKTYGWLDAPVFAKSGVHLSSDMELLDDVIAASPSVVFMCFGMNDVGVFEEKVERYVSRYSDCIRQLKASLPDAVIYVHATLPVTEKAQKKRGVYKYIDEYNEAMRQACPALGAYYIDSSFLLREKPELYNPDGIHPRREYYPMWLTYLADIAGLSND